MLCEHFLTALHPSEVNDMNDGSSNRTTHNTNAAAASVQLLTSQESTGNISLFAGLSATRQLAEATWKSTIIWISHSWDDFLFLYLFGALAAVCVKHGFIMYARRISGVCVCAWLCVWMLFNTLVFLEHVFFVSLVVHVCPACILCGWMLSVLLSR